MGKGYKKAVYEEDIKGYLVSGRLSKLLVTRENKSKTRYYFILPVLTKLPKLDNGNLHEDKEP